MSSGSRGRSDIRRSARGGARQQYGLVQARAGAGYIYVGSWHFIYIERLSSGHQSCSRPSPTLTTETFRIMTSFTTLFFVFLSIFTLSFAAPLHLDARDVYAPPVTYPRKGGYFSTSF